MGDRAIPPAPASDDQPVVIRLAIQTLRSPETYAASARSMLDSKTADAGPSANQRLLLLASLIFTRPELITSGDIAALGAILRQDDSDEDRHQQAGEVLEALLTTPLAREVIEVAIDSLRDCRCQETSWRAAVEVLIDAVRWVPDLLNAEVMIGLAKLEHLSAARRVLTDRIIEPLLLQRPLIGDALCDRLNHDVEDGEATKYTWYFVKGKDRLPPAIAAAFSLHESVAALRQGTRRVLLVHNIRHGVGDEIIRCVPLLQAFLDANPELTVTVVTRRAYLYAHPRITSVSTDEHERIEDLWRGPFDAVVDFVQPGVPASSSSVLEEAVQAYVSKHTPWLLLWATNTANEFVFQRVEVASRPVAAALGLDRLRVTNPYETSFRMIAELGLPLNVGKTSSTPDYALAGEHWPHAETRWREITAHNHQRPIALLNPHGGGHQLKGCSDAASVAAEIRPLLDEGYFVVVLPSGTAWGRAKAVEAALECLTADERTRVAIGADAGDEDDDVIPPVPRLSPLSYPDYVMRLIIHWIAYADLVVTVEGWMLHASYCLAKPYRALMFAYSEPEWCPYARSECQQVSRPASARAVGDLGQLPDWARKQTLLFLLKQIAEARLNEGMPLFRRALQSGDRNIRQAAAAGLIRCPGHELAEIVALLQDESRGVRGIAAQALLDRRFSSSRIPVEHLSAHVLIGKEPLDWRPVIALGPAIRPVLELARDGDEPSVRREAAMILRMFGAGRRGERGGFLSRIWGRSSRRADNVQEGR